VVISTTWTFRTALRLAARSSEDTGRVCGDERSVYIVLLLAAMFLGAPASRMVQCSARSRSAVATEVSARSSTRVKESLRSCVLGMLTFRPTASSARRRPLMLSISHHHRVGAVDSMACWRSTPSSASPTLQLRFIIFQAVGAYVAAILSMGGWKTSNAGLQYVLG